jgi:hypothetical protein
VKRSAHGPDPDEPLVAAAISPPLVEPAITFVTLRSFAVGEPRDGDVANAITR